MALTDHARAARILGETIGNRAEQMGDPTGVLTCLAEAYTEAAEMMEDADRAEAVRMAEAHRCTLDHARLTVPKCPACGAARG
jgi:hypothetical protein